MIYFSLLVALIGAVAYLLANPQTPRGSKFAELGRVAYFVGLLAFLLQAVPHLVTLFR